MWCRCVRNQTFVRAEITIQTFVRAEITIQIKIIGQKKSLIFHHNWPLTMTQSRLILPRLTRGHSQPCVMSLLSATGGCAATATGTTAAIFARAICPVVVITFSFFRSRASTSEYEQLPINCQIFKNAVNLQDKCLFCKKTEIGN